MLGVMSICEVKNAELELKKQNVDENEMTFRAASGVLKNLDLAKKTLIVVGSGNNGGDGVCLFGLMKQKGLDVKIVAVSEKLSDTSKFFADKFEITLPIEIISESFDFSSFEQVVDCMLGTGFRGELRSEIGKTIEKINSLQNVSVISVDVPSGLNGDSGLAGVFDGRKTAIKSQFNLAIGALKSGLILNDAKDFIVKNEVVDIGFKSDYNKFLAQKGDFKDVFFKRKSNSHKGSFGFVGLFGGSDNFSGASKLSNLALCSLSSLKSGAGISRLIVPSSIKYAVMPYLLESTLFSVSESGGFLKFEKDEIDKATSGLEAMAFGMGIGENEETEKTLSYLLKTFDKKLIIDADGLNALAKIDLKLLAETKAKVVITPHVKEFSRITHKSVAEILENPLCLANEFAEKYHVIVLLKGVSTIVCDGKTAMFVAGGAPGMATAGSGDVLSGVLCGILGYNDLSVKSVSAGAYLTGLAGELADESFGSISMTASDTVKFLPKALSFLAE